MLTMSLSAHDPEQISKAPVACTTESIQRALSVKSFRKGRFGGTARNEVDHRPRLRRSEGAWPSQKRVKMTSPPTEPVKEKAPAFDGAQ